MNIYLSKRIAPFVALFLCKGTFKYQFTNHFCFNSNSVKLVITFMILWDYYEIHFFLALSVRHTCDLPNINLLILSFYLSTLQNYYFI